MSDLMEKKVPLQGRHAALVHASAGIRFLLSEMGKMSDPVSKMAGFGLAKAMAEKVMADFATEISDRSLRLASREIGDLTGYLVETNSSADCPFILIRQAQEGEMET